MAETGRALRTITTMGYRADPRRWVVYVVCIVTWQALPLVGALLVRTLIDAVLDDDATRTTVVGLLMGATAALTFVTARARSRTIHVLIEKSTEAYDREIIRLSSSIPGIDHLESPAFLDRLEQLRYQPQALGLNGLQSTVMIWGTVQAVLVIGLLVTIDPLLVVLPVIAAPSLLAGRRAEDLRRRAFEEGSTERRLANAFFELATAPGRAEEVRTLRVGHQLLAGHDAAWTAADRRMHAAEVRAALLATTARVLFALSYLAAVALVVQRGLTGHASLGDVVLTVVVAGLLNQQVGVVIDAIGRVLNALTMVERFLWLQDEATAHRPPPPAAPTPERLRDGIHLRGVSYRYPGGTTDVLAGVDLHLPAGAVVALVGDNGAGKSTLVKLLTGLYHPTGGVVAVDGTDLADLGPEAWRARSTAAFQDFARLELELSEAVGVGDLPRIDDRAAVADALERGGGGELLTSLPGGPAALLGASFEGGVPLSGGQWQQVALGRAMMRRDPLLVVLDEPSASLDPTAEHRLFERYARHARATGAHSGAVTVLVSHRLSSGRAADLVVVLDGGRVTEAGTHAELVGAGGLYAELFRLQADGYR